MGELGRLALRWADADGPSSLVSPGRLSRDPGSELGGRKWRLEGGMLELGSGRAAEMVMPRPGSDQE